MRVNEYQEKCKRTIDETGKSLMINSALGLCGESGEVADHLKKHLFQGHSLCLDEMIKELGDISWYVSAMATALGVTLEEIFTANIEKLEKRYPNGFNKDRSVNRNENTKIAE